MTTAPKGPHDPRSRRPIIGRDAELSLLHGLVDPPPGSSRLLALLGDAGMGKSLLLEHAVSRAEVLQMRVLRTTGRESEVSLAFAALDQLLQPLVEEVDRLPDHLRMALDWALGRAPGPMLPDRLEVGTAVRELIMMATTSVGLLMVIDDVHWIDRSSLDALTFACHRLDQSPVVVLFGCRGSALPRGLDRIVTDLHLEALSDRHARELLDQQQPDLRQNAREEVLRQAAGNPMALIELAGVVSKDPGVVRRWSSEPIPVGARLAQLISDQLDGLEDATRDALLLASVADGSGEAVMQACLDEVGIDVLASAETIGLVELRRSGLRFTHPIIRSAVYHSAAFGKRAQAHRRLANLLRDQPDRRAWHLAAALATPDGAVASLLEDTADQAQARGGAVPAALAMERAAELTEAPRERARRLVEAAYLAATSGQFDWVRHLAAQAMSETDEPGLQLSARQAVGHSLIWTSRHQEALDTLLSVAELAPSVDISIAWESLGAAATVVYQSNLPGSRESLRRAVEQLDGLEQRSGLHASPGEDDDLGATRLWIQAALDPIAFAMPGQRPLPAYASQRSLQATSLLGAAAWVIGETEEAVRFTNGALRHLRQPGIRGTSGPLLSVLELSLLELGRWEEAMTVVAEATELALAYDMDIVAATADVTAAMIHALRGDAVAAGARAHDALKRVRIQHSAAVDARARHALGMAAFTEGDHEVSYSHLAGLFPSDGPLHYHVSYLAVADLALTATRMDRTTDARTILADLEAGLPNEISPRIRQILARAHGLLDDESAEEFFATASMDPAGRRWPFEHAQLRLDYAHWLRRHRRINEAKPLLFDAAETFERLHADPWTVRAKAELRAAGVPVAVDAGFLTELTPQQVEIVTLASQGFTNRQIADRMFLSSRTVASHLYRSFPKLGVTDRRQLRDALARLRSQSTLGPS